MDMLKGKEGYAQTAIRRFPSTAQFFRKLLVVVCWMAVPACFLEKDQLEFGVLSEDYETCLWRCRNECGTVQTNSDLIWKRVFDFSPISTAVRVVRTDFTVCRMLHGFRGGKFWDAMSSYGLWVLFFLRAEFISSLAMFGIRAVLFTILFQVQISTPCGWSVAGEWWLVSLDSPLHRVFLPA